MGISLDLAENVRHVRPYLGILLVLAVALFFGYVALGAVRGLTDDLNSALPRGVEGSIVLAQNDKLSRGDSVRFVSDIYGDVPAGAMTYITLTCFQGSRLVYGQVGEKDATFSITGQPGRTTQWIAGPAACSAALMYRVVEGSINTVFLVDSANFQVVE